MFGVALDVVEEVVSRVVKKAFKDWRDEGADREKLKAQLEELRLEKRIEEAELKHLVKMKEEKIAVEAERKEIAIRSEFHEKEMELRTKLHEELITKMEAMNERINETYGEIIKRLPNVNMEITKGK